MEEHTQTTQQVAILIGRILIGGLFLFSGIVSLLNFELFVAATASVPLLSLSPLLFASAGIIFKIVGGLGLLLGYFTRYAAIALIIFTLLATLFFNLDITDNRLIKNLMIIGGLLAFTGFGGGYFSLDQSKRR